MPQQPAPVYPQQAAYAPPQPQQPALTSPAARTNESSSWTLALVSAVVVGIVAAFVYALVSSLVNRELLILMVFLGAGPGAMIVGIARPKSLVARLISMVLSIVLGAAAIAAAIVLYVAAEAMGSIWSGISNLGNINYDALFRLYFSDAMGYFWVALGLIAAVVVGKPFGKRAID
jgi:hypothetical protein